VNSEQRGEDENFSARNVTGSFGARFA